MIGIFKYLRFTTVYGSKFPLFDHCWSSMKLCRETMCFRLWICLSNVRTLSNGDKERDSVENWLKNGCVSRASILVLPVIANDVINLEFIYTLDNFSAWWVICLLRCQFFQTSITQHFRIPIERFSFIYIQILQIISCKSYKGDRSFTNSRFL